MNNMFYFYNIELAEKVTKEGKSNMEKMKKNIKLSRIIDDTDMNKPIVHVDYDFASLYPRMYDLTNDGNTTL